VGGPRFKAYPREELSCVRFLVVFPHLLYADTRIVLQFRIGKCLFSATSFTVESLSPLVLCTHYQVMIGILAVCSLCPLTALFLICVYEQQMVGLFFLFNLLIVYYSL
jgi:hypothetical protein